MKCPECGAEMKAIACGFSCGPCFLAELMAEPVHGFGRKGHPGGFAITEPFGPKPEPGAGVVMTAAEAAAFGAFIRAAK